MSRLARRFMVPSRRIQDEAWCEMLASHSADELVAGKLIEPERWEHAMRAIRQQAYVLLVSDCYPAGDLNPG